MGVRHLNRFLKHECKSAISLLSLSQLSGKKIVIDTSIYLYKFSVDGNESLIENFFLMLNVFRYHKITPVFVFDGTTPAEKKALLMKRQEDKRLAEKEYYSLKENMDSLENDNDEKREIQQQMIQLKKQFVYIRRDQILEVKKLLHAYGTEYMESDGEADELCALLVSRGDVWACLSEDMDLFVYGTARVLRYLSIINHNVVLYDLPEILKQLGITQEELRKICILSGTDYTLNVTSQHRDLNKTIQIFKQWKKDYAIAFPDFYRWLIQNTDYMKEEEMETLKKVEERFELKSSPNQNINNTDLCVMIHPASKKKIEKKWMETILKNAGFLL